MKTSAPSSASPSAAKSTPRAQSPERRLKAAEATLRAKLAERACELLDRTAPMALGGSFASADRTRLTSRRGLVANVKADLHRDRLTLDLQIRRCRAALRDSTIFRLAVSALVASAVGPEPDLVMQSEDSAYNDAVLKWYHKVNAEHGFDARGLQSQAAMLSDVVTALATDGRLLGLKLRAGTTQLIEQERLRTPGDVRQSREWVDGVMIDQVGRPRGYRVCDWDASGHQVDTARGSTYRPEFCVYMLRPTIGELNLTVAEPALQSLLDRIERLEQTDKNISTAYEIATLFAVIFQSPAPQDLQDSMFGAARRSVEGGSGLGPAPAVSGGYGQDAEITLAPGQLLSAPEGTQAFQVRPEHPSQPYEAFAKMQLRLLYADAGLPLEVALFLAEQNYSASRAALSASWPRIEVWQYRVVKPFASAMLRHKLAADLRAGLVRGVTRIPEDWDAHDWILPTQPVLDPAVEIKWISQASGENFISKEQGARLLMGNHFKTIAATRREETKLEREYGIEPPQMPGAKVSGESQEKKETEEQVTE